ncbi:MAG: hypothetical protein ACK51Z_17780 [Pseudomonadota bacterium]
MTSPTGPTPSRAAVAWSGGKDACLARLRAREAGLHVATCLTVCDAEAASLSHALPRHRLAQQIAACGVDWRSVEVPCVPGGCAAAFDAALAAEVLARGIHARIVAVDLGEFHTAVNVAPGMSAPVPLPDRGFVVEPSPPLLAPTWIARLVVADEGAPA